MTPVIQSIGMRMSYRKKLREHLKFAMVAECVSNIVTPFLHFLIFWIKNMKVM
jgi:hypothetical protein